MGSFAKIGFLTEDLDKFQINEFYDNKVFSFHLKTSLPGSQVAYMTLK